jgi:N-acetylmuramoyl-L-alanine amidase
MMRGMRIYLDPGHGEGVTGQHDPGAVGPTGLTENEVTFDVAKRLGHLLREKGVETLGATLNANRDDENLNEAVKAANTAGVDLFISLHCNSATTPSAHGVEVWHGGSAAAEKVANTVLSRITAEFTGGKGAWLNGRTLPLASRGVKKGTFAVLRNTHMPAILVEMAFISNRQEEGWLREATVRQQFAQAIADGILDALG